MQLIDTHAHLDFCRSKDELDAVIQRAKDAGLVKIICCSARFNDWQNYQNLARENPDFISWQIGLHPTEISDTDFDLLKKIPDFLKSDTPPVSVGEIGLDFYNFEGTPAQFEALKNLQTKFFVEQLNIAKDLSLPVCIHARSAVKESIDVMQKQNFDFSKVVFHCFSGDLEEIKLLNSLGARASFTGIITFKNGSLMRDVMLTQGLEKLMLETDCPYLAPVPLRGKTNEPANVALTAKKAAELFGISQVELCKITTQNSRTFFNL